MALHNAEVGQDAAIPTSAGTGAVGLDNAGHTRDIPLADDTRPVNFIVHRPGGESVPTTREPGGDRSFVPIGHPEILLEQGDPTIYYSPPAP